MSEANSEDRSTSCISASPCKDGHLADSWLAGAGAYLPCCIPSPPADCADCPVPMHPGSADLSAHGGLCAQQASVSVVQLMQSRSLGHRSSPGDCRLQLLCDLQIEVAVV